MPPRKKAANKKAIPKVTPPKESKVVEIQTPPFHILFPITLTYKEDKVVKNCYFQVEDHLIKYIDRTNLKKGQFTISPTQPRNEE